MLNKHLNIFHIKFFIYNQYRMATVGDLILEKKTNFTNFLHEVIANEEVGKLLSSEELSTCRVSINKINNASVPLFIFFITKDVMEERHDLKSYLNKFLITNGVREDSIFLNDEKLNDYPPVLLEYKEKAIKYLQMFINIIEYSFE